MRLNGWQRMGIGLSVIWLVVLGFLKFFNRLDDGAASALYQRELEYCEDMSDNAFAHGHPNITFEDETKQKEKCVASASARFERDYAEHAATWSGTAIFYALTTIFAWLITWGLFGLGRWIGRGFAAK